MSVRRQMHCGRHDVIGRLVAELHDEFAKIGLKDLDALFSRAP